MLISWKEKKQFPRLQNNKDDFSVWFHNQGDGLSIFVEEMVKNDLISFSLIIWYRYDSKNKPISFN